eukprot:scaffold80159_cov22-Tisochrysis_lutea.AAC.1
MGAGTSGSPVGGAAAAPSVAAQERFKAAKSISSQDFQPKDDNTEHERQMQLNRFQVRQNANAISSADYFERDENGAPIDGGDISAADLVNRLSYQGCKGAPACKGSSAEFDAQRGLAPWPCLLTMRSRDASMASHFGLLRIIGAQCNHRHDMEQLVYLRAVIGAILLGCHRRLCCWTAIVMYQGAAVGAIAARRW